MNTPVWSQDPYSPLHVLSRVLMTVALFPVLDALYLFNSKGKPKGKFENTTVLVTGGIYRYIRHPMYASLFYVGTGVYLKDVNGVTTALALLNFLAVWATARIEEGEMIAKFGDEYRLYAAKTKRFIPYLF